jgi:hypothetical protein
LVVAVLVAVLTQTAQRVTILFFLQLRQQAEDSALEVI